MSSETGHSSSSRRLTLKDVTDAPHASEDSVGMELRAMRLQRGESLSQVSQVLRIRKDMVEAIEHGRHDLLPGHAYEVGFVRAYADYMRLDTADIVRRYKAELASLDEGEHFKIQVAEEDQRFSFVSVSVIVLCLAAAVAGALQADTFVFFTDVPGLRDAAGETVKEVTSAGVERLIAEGAITGGMIPKMEAALSALRCGVGRVVIRSLSSELGGTVLREI